MGKITRFLGNVVAFASGATGTNRTIFGDSTTQSDTLTDNLNADAITGWEAGLDPVTGFPPQEFFNAVGFTSTQLAAYLFQMGIAEWDSLQEFNADSFTNRNGNLYRSLSNANIGNDPETDAANWENFGQSKGNFIVNGSFAIAQENTSFTLSAGVEQFTLDMHLNQSDGGNATVARVANTLSGSNEKYMMQITGAAGVTAVYKRTRIESKNSSSMKQLVTYSVLIKNNSGGPISPVLKIKTADVEDIFSALTVVDTNNFAAIPDATEIRISYTSDLSAETTVSRGVEIELDLGVALTANTINIGQEVVEPGSFVNKFPFEPYQATLAKCQSYWKSSYNLGVAPGTVTTVGEIDDAITSIAVAVRTTETPVRFRETMRKVPSVTLYSPTTGTSGKIFDSFATADLNGTVASTGQDGFVISVVYPSQNGFGMHAHYVANARLV